MPSFLALVRGSNFDIADMPEHGRLGFFTAREVVAEDWGAVESAAVSALRADPDLRARTANPPEDPPLLFVEEVAPLAPGLRPSQRGFTFYPDGDDGSEERARELERKACGLSGRPSLWERVQAGLRGGRAS